MAAEDETVYCLCRLPYDDTRFMIECDVCNDWFHGNCVGVQEHQASDIEIYHCPNCQKEHGPLTLKKRRNWHRHDYSETDSSKAVQTGTVTFIKELKNRNFTSASEIPILRVKGSDLTVPYFEENGFEVPILVEKKDGLEIKVPPYDFSIQDIENLVGSMREIDVIDVARQEDYKMLMREWTEYYNSPDRDKIFNVISLEFSNTKLSELVIPPKIVRQVSWVNNMWPDNLPDDCTYSRPEVQKYCLMGVQDSFTDFHIDFGGTSVWYHVLRGEKVFYLIRPTPANMDLYESWISSSNQSETFFGDQVDNCYKSVVTAGQTLFIPTGWIHAVFTPVDTLVFGGNFLHSYNIPLQLKVYEIERHVKTPEKYLFPSFETICWYAAKYVLDILKDCEEDGKKASNYIISGAKSLAQHLKSWTQRKDLNSQYIFAKSAKHDVPEHIQYGKLLKELVKVSRNFEVQTALKPKVERKRRKKNIPTPKQMESLDILHQHTTEKLQELQKQEHKIEEHKNVYAFSDEPPSPPPTSLKMRIPKAGAFIDNVLKTVKEEEENLNPVDISSLKLKVSNGRIVGDNVKPDVLNIGKFQPLMTDFDDDGDSDPDQLVVDESPTVRKKNKPGENNSRTTMKPGSLKLKLSFSGKYPNDNDGQLPAEGDGTPPTKRQRKTPAAKKEKKPAAPKTKSPGPKTAATKKEPKKAPARATKGKAKQTKDQNDDKNFNLEEQGLDADSSKLGLNHQANIMNTLKADPLTIKVKPDYSLQRAATDSLLLLDQNILSIDTTVKDEVKSKKTKGEPKGKRGAAKKTKGETGVNAGKEESAPKKGKNEATPKAAKGDSSNKKTKSKEADIKMEPAPFDTKIEPLMADTKYELPFLETRFEPLLEIKSDTPVKKGKGESKRGRGAAKKTKEESKGKGSKKGKTDNVSIETEVKENTSLDDFDNDQLVINLQDTKTTKRGKAAAGEKKSKSKATPKKAKDNSKINKETPVPIVTEKGSRVDQTETTAKKTKTETPGKKSKNESAGNKSKIDPLFLNLKKNSQLEKSTSSVTSNQTDSLKMAWSDLPLMTSPQHERKPLTSPQPDLQSLMAIRANLQSLTSSRPDSQSLARQDHSSSKQDSSLKSPQSDPFSCLSKKSGPLSSLSSPPSSSSPSSTSASLLSTALSSKHSKSDPLSLTPTRPDPLSLLPKKTDSLSLTSPKKDSLSTLSKKSEALFLLPKKPDPLSLVPKKPDPLSLIPKKPDPLSLLPKKPDPHSLKITKSDSSLLGSKMPDSPSLKARKPDPLSLVTSHNNNTNTLSLLNNKPDPLSLQETKPDPLSEAFLNNKEPLTPKDKSLLINNPKSESSLSKKLSVDPQDQSGGKLSICEEVPNTKETSKAEEKKDEASRTAVDIKVDKLASILKSESLLSKARLSTLKPLDIPAKGNKEVDQATSSLPTTKHVEKLPSKEKVPSNSAGKAKQSAEAVAANKASSMLESTPKSETIISLRAELQAKQLAMQAKIAEEEGGGSNKKDLSVTETEQSKRMNMPTIRGGLNCGIADILEASGYGTETDFQVDEDVSAPSPTMRDAIQGMLYMSRMGSPQLFSGGAALGKGRKQWSGLQPDEEEQLEVCYKDDEYIYPSLDISDDEDPHIFKPRGKQKKDETWNPKARVQVSGEKRERVARDSARREFMESTMAATVAKYETIAKSKKGNRKRLKTEESSEDVQPPPLPPPPPPPPPPMSPGHTVSHNLSPAATTATPTTVTTTTTTAAVSKVSTEVLPAVASTSTAADGSFSPTNITGTASKGAVVTGTPTTMAAVPGTSSGSSSSNGAVSGPLQSRPFTSPLSCPSKSKKPKKGFATAKQRLGRILKIHKMRF